MRLNVLGIKIDDVTMDQALKVVENWLSKVGKYYIVTPNPEMVVAAQGDKVFKKILNDADLSIPDGGGLRLSGKVKNLVSGTDFMEKLVELAAKNGFTVGFLGGRDRVAEKCAERLLGKYPRLKVIFTESGGEVDQNGNVIARSERGPHSKSGDKQSIFSKIATLPSVARNDNGIDILFVAFGPPKQEKWIKKNLPKINVRVAMGVGGAFDYFSDTVPRAPKWTRDLGLEWLFRLIIQPWRIKRQLSLLKYLYLLIRD